MLEQEAGAVNQVKHTLHQEKYELCIPYLPITNASSRMCIQLLSSFQMLFMCLATLDDPWNIVITLQQSRGYHDMIVTAAEEEECVTSFSRSESRIFCMYYK